MAKPKKEKKDIISIISPIGLLSYPYLSAPDTGRAESSNKYGGEIYIPKPIWVKEGKPILDAVHRCAAEYFNDPKIKLKDIRIPIFDMDTKPDCPTFAANCIRLRGRSKNQPRIIGPKKDKDGRFPTLSEEDIKNIKAGDFVRFIGTLYGYPQQGGGVALGLNFVQFGYKGEPIGQGSMQSIENLEEIEVEMDDPENMADTEETDPLKFG